ncbi:hypothetical protein [Desulfosporosinus sp.]|uniref:hypothetical protein n=1 Tax=Desulfosporosinus sp. TaxID=157907 RepID=UPI0023274AFE|nr:hypothetical protein [Desulfosporosinus sp.]MDA8221493.1 hypothetical protein [Desulfitobacterium hafniense]
MIEKALRYINSFRDIQVIPHNGLSYTNDKVYQLPEDAPAVFSTKTLASLVELIIKEHSHNSLNDLIVHVDSPTKVNVHTVLREHLDRFNLYTATAELPRITLDNYIDLEAMNILLKSAFVQNGTRDQLIKVLGQVVEDAIKTSADDGMAQEVTVKTGIRTLAKMEMPTIVNLAPYRTFVEVAQPEGEFLLRMRKGPEAALFEADGGAWKLQARKNIKQYFEIALADLIESGKVVVTE